MTKVGGESHNNWLDGIANKKDPTPNLLNENNKSDCSELKSFIHMDKCPDFGNTKPFPDNFPTPVNIFGNNPKEVIENIRNADSKIGQYKELVDFQGKLDQMPGKDLKATRDYLVNEIANPTNKDDELLGVLLKSVNKEIDSRENPLHLIQEKPIGPMLEPLNINHIKPEARFD